jgi:ELWxxDGT repeat protein
MKKILLSYLLVGCAIMVISTSYSQSPTLVKDINTVHTSLGGVEQTITYNGYVYFIQDDGINGLEIWRTDGSTTEIFTDIDNEIYGSPHSLTVWNNMLYFATGTQGTWKSDGTVVGTEIFTTVSGRIIPASTELYLFNTESRVLSITDGVSATDSIGMLGAYGLGGYQFTTVSDGLFYTISNNTIGNEIVYEDGNPANPPVVMDLYPGTDGSFPGAFTVYNGKLHFMAVRHQEPYGTYNDGKGFKTLFESDGTVSGTVSVADFTFGGLSSRTTQFIAMKVFDGNLIYYDFLGGSSGLTELYKYDGTTHTLIHTFANPGIFDYLKNVYFNTVINGVLYFSATDNSVLSHWQTDGSTVISSTFSAPNPTLLDQQLIYPAGQTLASSDLSGTVTVIGDFTNTSNISPWGLTTLGGNLFFVATQDADGSQLWKTDGTTNTQVTTNGIASTKSSNALPIFELDGTMYFSADDGTGSQLWKTDGTEGNTMTVGADIPTANGVELNNEYYYSLGNSTNDELWKTDGTTFTSVFTVENNISDLTVSGSNIFFVTYTAAEGVELWVSDGTSAPEIIDLVSGTGATQPGSLTDVNGTLYFQGLDINNGSVGLWKSDGTFAGTTVVFSDDYDISNLSRSGDDLFFVVDNLFDGIEPMMYSTAAEGFQMFDLNESGDSKPYGFQELGGEMYFFTESPRALWKYDGLIPEHAVLIESLPNANASTVIASSNMLFYFCNGVQYAYNGTDVSTFTASMNQPITIDNIVYFKVASTKWELWETDGSTEGTKYITDFPANEKLFSFNDELYFGYDDGLLGKELHQYKSDKQGFALTANADLNVTDNTEIDLTLDWTPGDGDGRIVLISTSQNMDLPVDGEAYTANTTYGASALGASTNTYVIGNGATATTDVTDLIYGSTYYISIIEYTEPTPGDFLYDRQNILRDSYFAPKIEQSINLTPITSKTYGDDNNDVEATSTSGETVTYSIVSGPGTFSGNTLVISGAGDIVFDANVVADATYNAATLQTTVSVAKAALTATAADAAKIYGDSNPAFNVDYSGFVKGELVAVLDASPTPSTTADASSNAGIYDITLTAGSDNNYEITTVEGTLTVTKAALTANVSNASKTYGEANPSFTLAYSGFVNGEDESVIDTAPTVSTVADETSDTDTYPITVTGGLDNNYEITNADGTLTINKASLTAIIIDQERQYGQQNLPVTFTYTGLLNNDTAEDIDSHPNTTTTAAQFSAVGTYAITGTSTGSDNNYNIPLPSSGTLTIIKADQIITLDAIADQDYSISNQVSVSSTISSNLQVALSVTGPASISGNLITLDGTNGTVTVTASQAGDQNYNEAADVSVSFQAFASNPCFNFEAVLISTEDNSCNGDSEASIDIDVTGGDGNYTYSWSSGQDTQDLSNITAGTYTVTVTDGNACSATVTATIVDPDPIVKPIITADFGNPESPTLFVSNVSGDSYEWFLDGTSLGAGNSSTIVDQQGSYTVIVSANGCSSEESDPFVILVTASADKMKNEIQIYPNPVKDKLIVMMEANQGDKQITITGLNGKIFYQKNTITSKTTIDTGHLMEGVYVVHVRDNNGVSSYKVIKE